MGLASDIIDAFKDWLDWPRKSDRQLVDARYREIPERTRRGVLRLEATPDPLVILSGDADPAAVSNGADYVIEKNTLGNRKRITIDWAPAGVKDNNPNAGYGTQQRRPSNYTYHLGSGLGLSGAVATAMGLRVTESDTQVLLRGLGQTVYAWRIVAH